jgi:hypothetical protein
MSRPGGSPLFCAVLGCTDCHATLYYLRPSYNLMLRRPIDTPEIHIVINCQAAISLPARRVGTSVSACQSERVRGHRRRLYVPLIVGIRHLCVLCVPPKMTIANGCVTVESVSGFARTSP